MTSILRHNRLALLGGGVLLLMVAISVAASWIASMDPAMMQPRMRLTPPGGLPAGHRCARARH